MLTPFFIFFFFFFLKKKRKKRKKEIYNKFLIVYIYIYINISNLEIINGIKVKLAIFSYFEYVNIYHDLIVSFNNYSKENHLDIIAEMHLFSEKNMTLGQDDFASSIDLLLNRKSIKYDMYTYDICHTKRYSYHFIDLKKWMPEEHLNLYLSGEGSKICTYNNKWVGMVK